MINRRELLFAAGCATALGAAEVLRPRETLVLLPKGRTLVSVVPERLGTWQVGQGGDIVLPQTPGSLASRLYSDRLARSYRHTVPAFEEIMLLIAYGAAQSDILQLHRPEVCYPAVGFSVTMRRLVTLPLAPGITLPAVMLTAEAGERVEDIIYWTRLGEALPQTSGEQRWARLHNAMAGFVADGVLVRASATRMEGRPAFPVIADFLRALATDATPAGRPALVGTTLAAALAR